MYLYLLYDMKWEGEVINKQALEDSTAVLETSREHAAVVLPYQGAICYCWKHAEVPFFSGLSKSYYSLCFPCVFVVYLYLAWAREEISRDHSEKYGIHFTVWELRAATNLYIYLQLPRL